MAPFALVIASFVSPGLAPFPDIAGSIGMIGFAFASLNAWLSFGRPFAWRLRKGTMDGYKFISGFPMIGTVLGLCACSAGFGEIIPTLLALLTFIIDTSGLPWFIYATWKDQGFWDSPTAETG